MNELLQIAIYELHIITGDNYAFLTTYASCWDAVILGGILPNLGESIEIKLTDNTTKQCAVENLHEQALSCPIGWYGKGSDEFCLNVKTVAVDNEEAARLCYEEGSDLLQVESQTQDDYIIAILASRAEYSRPLHPGFYHMGLHQRRSGSQYYYRNGARV